QTGPVTVASTPPGRAGREVGSPWTGLGGCGGVILERSVGPALTTTAGSSTGLSGATSSTMGVSLGRRLTRIIFFSAFGGSMTGRGAFLVFSAEGWPLSLSAFSGLSGFSSRDLAGLAASMVLGGLTREAGAGFLAFPAAFARIFATVSSSRAAIWFETVTPIPLRSLIRSLL